MVDSQFFISLCPLCKNLRSECSICYTQRIIIVDELTDQIKILQIQKSDTTRPEHERAQLQKALQLKYRDIQILNRMGYKYYLKCCKPALYYNNQTSETTSPASENLRPLENSYSRPLENSHPRLSTNPRFSDHLVDQRPLATTMSPTHTVNVMANVRTNTMPSIPKNRVRGTCGKCGEYSLCDNCLDKMNIV